VPLMRTSLVLDYNGTPGDPSDDTVIDGSEQVVRPATGKPNRPDADLCTNVATYPGRPSAYRSTTSSAAMRTGA
jgi:hypothetical protein